MAAREHVELYRKPQKEQISHVSGSLSNKIKELKEQVQEQKEQVDHKHEIIVHKDKIQVQQKQSIDELIRELKRVVPRYEHEN